MTNLVELVKILKEGKNATTAEYNPPKPPAVYEQEQLVGRFALKNDVRFHFNYLLAMLNVS